nr:MAG TPA: hypothetical protein [Caudoviricetes sp.]
MFRIHFLLNLLKNANFLTRLPIFVRILMRVTRSCACACVYK